MHFSTILSYNLADLLNIGGKNVTTPESMTRNLARTKYDLSSNSRQTKPNYRVHAMFKVLGKAMILDTTEGRKAKS